MQVCVCVVGTERGVAVKRNVAKPECIEGGPKEGGMANVGGSQYNREAVAPGSKSASCMGREGTGGM